MIGSLSDPALRAQVYALFDVVWPGMARAIALAERATTPWHELSTPFVSLEGGHVVAHVGVLACPMIVAGRHRAVAGVHAVCTHPDFRRRGHARRLLEEACEWIDARYDVALLSTDRPAFYEPHGFRIVRESRFTLANVRAAKAPPMRRLTLDEHALVSRLYRDREPLGGIFETADPGWLAITDELLAHKAFTRFHYAADLDALVALEVRDATLHVIDIAAPRRPTLEEIAARVEAPFERIELHFTPSAPVDQEPAPPGDWLMARGDALPIERQPVRLGPLTRW